MAGLNYWGCYQSSFLEVQIMGMSIFAPPLYSGPENESEYTAVISILNLAVW